MEADWSYSHHNLLNRRYPRCTRKTPSRSSGSQRSSSHGSNALSVSWNDFSRSCECGAESLHGQIIRSSFYHYCVASRMSALRKLREERGTRFFSFSEAKEVKPPGAVTPPFVLPSSRQFILLNSPCPRVQGWEPRTHEFWVVAGKTEIGAGPSFGESAKRRGHQQSDAQQAEYQQQDAGRHRRRRPLIRLVNGGEERKPPWHRPAVCPNRVGRRRPWRRTRVRPRCKPPAPRSVHLLL